MSKADVAGSRAAVRKRRVWVVSELYFPELTSTGFFLTKIAEGLAEDFEVHALCGQPTHSARGTRAPYREQRNGVFIVRAPGTTLNKDRIAGRLLNMITLTVSMFGHLLTGLRNGDAVLVVTTPPAVPFATRLACAIRGASCVLLIHDLYPDNIIAAGLISRDSLAARALEAASRRLFRSVACVCVVGRDMKALVLRKVAPHRAPRIEVTPNWADGGLAPAPKSANPLVKELGLQDKFILQYAGNMGPVHGIEMLLEAAEQLAQLAPDVHFLFLGSGGKRRLVEDAVRGRRPTNITLLEHRPRSEQQVFLNACDVAITAFVPGMFGAGVPSRLYNVLETGKPFIAAVDEESEMALVITEERAGWVTPPGDVRAFTDAVLQARGSPERRADMGRRGEDAARRKYDQRVIVDQFRRLFASIVHPDPSSEASP